MSRRRPGRITPRQIPMCDVADWDGPPGTAGMRDHGRWRWCRTRATHRVTYHFNGGPRTEPCCDAHVAELVRRGEDHRAFMRVVNRTDVPSPVIVTITIAPDTRAAAHGHIRYILTEEPLAGPWQPAMLATGPTPLPTAPAPRRRHAAATEPTRTTAPAGAQDTLF